MSTDDPWLNELRRDPAPLDTVPGEGLTREDLLRMNAATGKPATGTLPGRVLLDVDGAPVGVEPSRPITSTFGGVAVTLDQLHAVGLTPADVPNVHIIDQKGTTNDR